MILRRFLLIGTAVSALLLGVIHHFALELYWYWMFWWMDVLTHMLGGILWGMVLLSVLRYLQWWNDRQGIYLELVLLVVVSVLFVGLMWESAELLSGLFITEEFFPDFIYDLLSAVAGTLIAVLGALLVSNHLSHNEREQIDT